MSNRSRYRGTGLIEVLSLLSALALAAAVLVPAASSVTMESRRLRSVENLRQIGQLSGNWSAGREDGIVHPQSTGGETNWIGLGAWDWGGTNGESPNYGSGGDFAEDTRPLNDAGPPGRSLLTSANTAIFHAPADYGFAPGPSKPDGGDISVARWTGTSYKGESIYFSVFPNANRFGTFMRPLNLIPVPAETTLFYEARFAQAFISSEEFIAGGAFGGIPTTVPGWYGDKSKFCVLFADGGVRTIRLRQSGDMYPIDSFDPVEYPYRSVMARGPGWRIDCFPAPFVVEHPVGNP